MSITLNTKVFSFTGIDRNNWSNYVNSVASVTVLGWRNLLARVRRGTSNSASQISWKLKYPVIASEASACACPGSLLREATVSITVTANQSMLPSELTDIGLMVKDLAASPEFQASIASLTQPTS